MVKNSYRARQLGPTNIGRTANAQCVLEWTAFIKLRQLSSGKAFNRGKRVPFKLFHYEGIVEILNENKRASLM